jgi:hypothetical protein
MSKYYTFILIFLQELAVVCGSSSGYCDNPVCSILKYGVLFKAANINIVSYDPNFGVI